MTKELESLLRIIPKEAPSIVPINPVNKRLAPLPKYYTPNKPEIKPVTNKTEKPASKKRPKPSTPTNANTVAPKKVVTDNNNNSNNNNKTTEIQLLNRILTIVQCEQKEARAFRKQMLEFMKEYKAKT